ncbi:MAG: glycosyltransferase [Desulfovibrio sp.]
MRVLHLITALETGGAETMLAKLVESMDSSAYEPVVVSMLRPGLLGERIRSAGVELHDLGMRRGLPSPLALARLTSLLRALRPDVVQTWLYHADLLGLAAVRLGFPLGGRPALAWNLRCSFMDFSQYRRSTAWTVRVCARVSGLPEAVVANSRSAVDRHIALGYVPRRFEIIPNGFDAERFRPRPEAAEQLRRELDLPAGALLAGMVARFDPMKDYRTFLRAAGRVAGLRADVHFVCCGRGADPENPELAHWARQARLNGRLHLLGQRSDVERILAGLDLCVSSSSGESFPNVLGEALCCGVPCVATDAGDSATIVGRAGEVVRAGDAEFLARAMARLLALPEPARRTLGSEGRMRMIREYSLESVAARYARFYDSLAGRSRTDGSGEE